MADESLQQLPSEQNIDFHIVTLFERLESIRKSKHLGILSSSITKKVHMHAEVRDIKFWRAVLAEFVSSFFYVFIVCGAAAASGVGASVSSVLLATALAAGFSIATLTQCFLHISGAHINPAVTLATAIIRAISPLRAFLYMAAQCGGGIAGAWLIYGVTIPGYQGNLQATVSHSASLDAWKRFGVELVLTFIVVLSYLVSTDSYKKHLGSAALSVGAAYCACSFVSMPYLNPARSLGPSFILSKWDNHWVYWLGPLAGGVISGIVFKFVFSTNRDGKSKNKNDHETSSLESDEDINYDIDLEKPNLQAPKFHGSSYNGYKAAQTQSNYCQSMYSGPPPQASAKLDRVESLYGGTRSLYCKSPPLTRANLNRSQSVYAKSNSALNRDSMSASRPGPLVPAQSLYPMRISNTQSSHVQNQNVQNQLQQRTESIYGIRGSMRQSERGPQEQQQIPSFQPIYGTRNASTPNEGVKFERQGPRESREEKFVRSANRPDSMYGISGQRCIQSTAQSDDSSYGSYHGPNSTPPTRNIIANPQANGEIMPNFIGQPQQNRNQQQQTCERKLSSTSSAQEKLSAFNRETGNFPPPPPPANGIYGQKQSQNTTNSGPLQHQYNMHPIRQN